MSPGSVHGPGAPAPPDEPRTPAWRLLATLGSGGALAGLLLVVVYQLTLPRIEAHKAEALQQAIEEVLHDPARFDTLYLNAGQLTRELPAGADPRALERVYLGYDDAETPVGFAITAAEPGFQDVIRLIFGFDPKTGALLGMKVLETKETPGLGDKIEKDSAFVSQFTGVAAPLQGVKKGAGKGKPGEVDLITGATISSRTVVRAINRALERWRPALAAYRERRP
ncbi:MAG: RnfABCDGE type electron transport complex subunit G [Gemmatimonadetes bacterium]|nr:RnfABCDGE type electron transport complex subunit G [Gemmatimonadota bacterium]